MSAVARRTIALLGGSFNPPHMCHVLMATWVLCRSAVDEIRLMPVYRHAFGKEMAPFDLRCQMVAAAVEHLGPRAMVDRIEERLSDGGAAANYTVDTVSAILAEQPQTALKFVVGTDLFGERTLWKDWDRLEQLLEFVVFGREGEPDPPGVVIQARLPALSSTEVRRRIRGGEPYGHLVPRPVRALIEQHGLYRP